MVAYIVGVDIYSALRLGIEHGPARAEPASGILFMDMNAPAQ
jgi:hypothetical protein